MSRRTGEMAAVNALRPVQSDKQGTALQGHAFVADRNVGGLTEASCLLDGVMVEQPALSCLDQGCVTSLLSSC